MSDDDRLRSTFLRNARALELRPSMGTGTATTMVRSVDGLTCEIEDGRWKLTADLSEKSGGASQGPDPGVLVRAALGSCLAMGYRLWAAKMQIPLSKVEVEVQADFDSRGQYGVGDGNPGYREVRYVVTVESDAPEEDVRNLIETADAHSPIRDDFARPLPLKREIRIVTPAS